jgi:hypothetical protein
MRCDVDRAVRRLATYADPDRVAVHYHRLRQQPDYQQDSYEQSGYGCELAGGHSGHAAFVGATVPPAATTAARMQAVAAFADS